MENEVIKLTDLPKISAQIKNMRNILMDLHNINKSMVIILVEYLGKEDFEWRGNHESGVYCGIDGELSTEITEMSSALRNEIITSNNILLNLENIISKDEK